MKLFRCDFCGNTIYFENVVCESCGHQLGYQPSENTMPSLEVQNAPEGAGNLVSLQPAGNNVWASTKNPAKTYVFCANAQHGACNWLVEYNPGADPFCKACRHNELVPPLDDPLNVERWQVIERAKKRLMYSLLQFGLPLLTRDEDPQHGLAFRFLAEAASQTPVMTGHENGIITLALSEADDAEREYRRQQFHEPYRTLLGHLRHEVGHHYWDLLVDTGGPEIDEFRKLFGDEREDYGEALKRHYAQGAPSDWQANFISAYATAHPWEDFAETWAHFLHVADTVEMASAFGVKVAPKVDQNHDMTGTIDFRPYRTANIGELIENWIPLASLMNNLNRAIGQPDPYPFILTPAVIEKLGYIQRLVFEAGQKPQVYVPPPLPSGASAPPPLPQN